MYVHGLTWARSRDNQFCGTGQFRDTCRERTLPLRLAEQQFLQAAVPSCPVPDRPPRSCFRRVQQNQGTHMTVSPLHLRRSKLPAQGLAGDQTFSFQHVVPPSLTFRRPRADQILRRLRSKSGKAASVFGGTPGTASALARPGSRRPERGAGATGATPPLSPQ